MKVWCHPVRLFSSVLPLARAARHIIQRKGDSHCCGMGAHLAFDNLGSNLGL